MGGGWQAMMSVSCALLCPQECLGDESFHAPAPGGTCVSWRPTDCGLLGGMAVLGMLYL